MISTNTASGDEKLHRHLICAGLLDRRDVREPRVGPRAAEVRVQLSREAVDDVRGGQRVAVPELDARPDREHQRLRIHLLVAGGEPRLELAGGGVAGQRLAHVRKRLGRGAGPRQSGIERTGLSLGQIPRHGCHRGRCRRVRLRGAVARAATPGSECAQQEGDKRRRPGTSCENSHFSSSLSRNARTRARSAQPNATGRRLESAAATLCASRLGVSTPNGSGRHSTGRLYLSTIPGSSAYRSCQVSARLASDPRTCKSTTFGCAGVDSPGDVRSALSLQASLAAGRGGLSQSRLLSAGIMEVEA